MAKNLYIVFNTAAGKTKSMRFENPRMDITKEEVENVANLVVSTGIFNVDGVVLASLKKADYKETVEEIIA